MWWCSGGYKGLQCRTTSPVAPSVAKKGTQNECAPAFDIVADGTRSPYEGLADHRSGQRNPGAVLADDGTMMAEQISEEVWQQCFCEGQLARADNLEDYQQPHYGDRERTCAWRLGWFYMDRDIREGRADQAIWKAKQRTLEP